jgi:hypothetical protein
MKWSIKETEYPLGLIKIIRTTTTPTLSASNLFQVPRFDLHQRLPIQPQPLPRTMHNLILHLFAIFALVLVAFTSPTEVCHAILATVPFGGELLTVFQDFNLRQLGARDPIVERDRCAKIQCKDSSACAKGCGSCVNSACSSTRKLGIRELGGSVGKKSE